MDWWTVYHWVIPTNFTIALSNTMYVKKSCEPFLCSLAMTILIKLQPLPPNHPPLLWCWWCVMACTQLWCGDHVSLHNHRAPPLWSKEMKKHFSTYVCTEQVKTDEKTDLRASLWWREGGGRKLLEDEEGKGRESKGRKKGWTEWRKGRGKERASSESLSYVRTYVQTH